MNCIEARELLSVYQELKKNQVDITQLEVHLANCATCRDVLNQYTLVGERIRELPPIELPADAHTRLMNALAVEHARFLERTTSSAISTPTPDFLKPYLKEQIPTGSHSDALRAFSSADTGPLPIIHPIQKRAKHGHSSQKAHFAIIGLAAAFLIVVMAGSLTSLLWLAKTNQNITSTGSLNQAQIQKPSQVTTASYATTTDYPHVASAVANAQYIYYTAYGDNSTGWMLEQMDIKSKVSTPLLDSPSSSQLVLLGSSANWLIWLQLDPAKQIIHKSTVAHKANNYDLAQTWTLYALPLNNNQNTAIQQLTTPQAILKGTFDQGKVPTWVHTPVQDITFIQNMLLIAWIDSKGTAHLTEQPLVEPGVKSTETTVELASATNGHILTSPTANSDGTSIFWSEEWKGDDNVPHGNIWTQQTVEAQPTMGKWVPHVEIDKFLFRNDGMSFSPQVVSDTLFLLSTDPNSNSATSTPTATPGAGTPTTTATVTVNHTPTVTPAATVTSGATATPTAGSQASATDTTITNKIDPTIYAPQFDASLQGTLLAFSLHDNSELKLPFDNNGQASALQGGGRFLLWQTSDNRFEMFDAEAKVSVTIGSTIVAKNTAFLAVNGDTTVWLETPDNNTNANQSNSSVPTVTFQMFNWPTRTAANS